MRDFNVGAPFTVLARDVWLLDRFMVENFPEPLHLARALLAHRVFALPPSDPLPGNLLEHVTVGSFSWDQVPEVWPGYVPCLYVAIDAPEPAVGALALFVGYWDLALRSPEAFRMKYRINIPSYSRRHLYNCWKNASATRGWHDQG